MERQAFYMYLPNPSKADPTFAPDRSEGKF